MRTFFISTFYKKCAKSYYKHLIEKDESEFKGDAS